MIEQAIFLLVLAVAGWLFARRVRTIRKTILLGKDTKILPSPERLRNMLLVAFGQKKMFNRPIPAILHLLVYLGFIIVNIEVVEIVLDGLLGTHHVVSGWLGTTLATFMVNVYETMAVAVIVSCIIFLIRRNIIRIKRFHLAEMKAWPFLDANLILVFEIALMAAFLIMNSADHILMRGDGHSVFGNLYFSGLLTPLLQGFSTESLFFTERVAWWFHIIGIFGFAIYVTYSKHLHIFLAFPNTYYAPLHPMGTLPNMPSITQEVKIMLGIEQSTPATSEPGRFGAKDVVDLDWTSLLSAYTCTECGRCSDVCPANLTGKKLSPRRIMMATRDRLEEIAKNMEHKSPTLDDGKSLLGDYISKEEINACTSCQACVEACPVLINPLGIIVELRRYIAMEESGSPASWNAMFQNIETNFAPWKFPATDRFNWSKKL